MNCPSYDLFFDTISTRVRMDILCLLKRRPMSVGEICAGLGLEQSKVSHNLKKLAECNIIVGQQKGKQRVYSLNKKTIVPILELVEKHVRTYCSEKCSRKEAE